MNELWGGGGGRGDPPDPPIGVCGGSTGIGGPLLDGGGSVGVLLIFRPFPFYLWSPDQRQQSINNCCVITSPPPFFLSSQSDLTGPSPPQFTPADVPPLPLHHLLLMMFLLSVGHVGESLNNEERKLGEIGMIGSLGGT